MRGGFVIHAVSGVAGYLSQLFGTPGREAHCTKCGGANFFRQPEVCLQRKLWHVAQHNGAKHIIGTGPRLPPRHPSQTRTPRPPNQQTQPHPGILSAWVSGHGFGQCRVRPHSRPPGKQGRPCHKAPESDTDPSRLVNKYLDSVADHKVCHRPTSNLPFHPIVLSLGGMMNGSTTKVFASWKRVMTRGTYNLMLKRLSLCLLQARVRSFEL
jgi:hypothetical protein